jgi:hypothetical protein
MVIPSHCGVYGFLVGCARHPWISRSFIFVGQADWAVVITVNVRQIRPRVLTRTGVCEGPLALFSFDAIVVWMAVAQ